jgi:hypothetical protein
MPFLFKEFDSVDEYNRWLTMMGERVKVVGMKTLRSKFTIVNGDVRPKESPSFLVTYKEVKAEGPAEAERRCTQCGALNPPNFKFCGDCGSAMRGS